MKAMLSIVAAAAALAACAGSERKPEEGLGWKIVPAASAAPAGFVRIDVDAGGARRSGSVAVGAGTQPVRDVDCSHYPRRIDSAGQVVHEELCEGLDAALAAARFDDGYGVFYEFRVKRLLEMLDGPYGVKLPNTHLTGAEGGIHLPPGQSLVLSSGDRAGGEVVVTISVPAEARP